MTILLSHLGCGDHLITQGLTRELAKQHDTLSIACWHHNIATLRHMFEDLDNVKFMVVNKEEDMFKLAEKPGAIKLGKYNGNGWDWLRWDQEFYRQAGVDFEKRWTEFQVPNIREKPVLSEEFNFLHQTGDATAHKYQAPAGVFTVIPTGFESIFDYVPYIRAAKEVHCVDSSFLCLVDSLKPRDGQKLVFHKYARNRPHPTLRREWKVLE